MISRTPSSRNSTRNVCSPLAAFLALGLALGGGISRAQTDSIGDSAEGTEVSELPRLDPENVDLSAFEGIEPFFVSFGRIQKKHSKNPIVYG